MFLGEERRALDEKGRLVIPARFRDALASGAVITRSPGPCLGVYPIAAFQERAEQLLSLDPDSPETDDRHRDFFGSAMQVELDRAGRFPIPQKLRKHADLDGEVAVVGRYAYLEIWGAPAWEREDARVSATTATRRR